MPSSYTRVVDRAQFCLPVPRGRSRVAYLPRSEAALNNPAMRSCDQCGTDAAEESLVRVGHDNVCPACLVRQFAVAQQHPERSSYCLVCETPLEGSSVAFFGRRICHLCVHQMNRELELGQAREQGPEQSFARSGESGSAESARDLVESEAGARKTVRFTPGSGTVNCDGCERPMPGPGSYRVIDARRYCAACLPFYAARAAPSASSVAVAREQMRRCACCDEPLPSAPQVHGGFAFCDACVTSDQRLALAVASARHRRRMRRLQDDLQTEDGDA